MSQIKRKSWCVCWRVAALIIAFMTASAVRAVSSQGQQFFLSFQPNLNTRANDNVALFISSATDAAGVVEIPELNFSQNFQLEPFVTTRIDLPTTIRDMLVNQRSTLGVRVTSNENITVYGLNQFRFTTDAFLALPVDTLGSEYRVLTYYGVSSSFPSQVAIVGVYDNTEVTILPSIRRTLFTDTELGDEISITLNSNETFLLWPPIENTFAGADLTGTRIISSAPVAVFSGSVCSFVPSTNLRACDHLVEMIPPVSTWGNTFLTVPLATRLRGDIFRVLASRDQTEIRINGVPVGTIDSGAFYETVLTDRSIITTSAPALVMQYSAGQGFDGVISDPFMMLVPPSEQFLNNYTFSALEEAMGFVNNFVNVVAPTPDITSIVLDGEPVNPDIFFPIGGSGFSGAQIPISEGGHTISSSTPFGIYVYGFGDFDSYGYPGGMNFDLINNSGDQYAPNLRLITMDNVVEGIAGDSEDLNLNDFLDVGEDLNGNAIIDRRTEDINRNGILDDGEDTNNDGILDRDTGVFRIELAGDAQNLELTLDNFIPGSLRAQFRVTLIDPSLPGRGTLVVTDGAGNTASEMISFSDEVLLQNVRVISTLSATDIDLDESSFTQAPTSIAVQASQTVIEWAFPIITIGQIEDLDYDIILRNPIASEHRLVTHNLELYFDDANGEQVYRALGQQFVEVLPSVFTINVATDRQDYTVDQTVAIDTQLANLSQFDTTSSVEITILDSNGNLVATVGAFPSLALAANEMTNLDMTQFNVGTTFLGTYIVRATLLNSDGEVEANADAAFNIVAPTESLYAATVTTDKPSYTINETVIVQDRVSNPAPNAILTGATAITTITTPDSTEFWRVERELPDIAVQGLLDFSHTVPLANAAPGNYTVSLSVLDAEGTERARSEKTITVESTQDSGVGLVAQITANPSPVFRTETTAIRVALSNNGNSAVTDLPATLAVIDVESQQILQAWSLGNLSLAQGATQTFDQNWLANVATGRHYTAVISADIAGESRTLANRPLEVTEKIVGELTAGASPGMLVWVDPAENTALDPTNNDQSMESPPVQDQRPQLAEFLSNDSHTVVSDQEAFTNELLSGKYRQYLILSDKKPLPEYISQLLAEAVNRGESLIVASGLAPRSPALLEALGVTPLFDGSKEDGKPLLTAGTGATLFNSEVHPAANINFDLDRLYSKVELTDATIAGKLQIENDPGYHDLPVLTHNAYGQGNAVYIGYDVLAEMTEYGAAQNPHAALLRNSINFAAPGQTQPHPGQVIPVALRLENLGSAVDITAAMLWPTSTQVVDTLPPAERDSAPISWSTTLAQNETSLFNAWAIPPYINGQAAVFAEIFLGDGVFDQPHQRLELQFASTDPEDVQHIVNDLNGLIAAETDGAALEKLSGAYFWLEQAAHANGQGEVALALNHALVSISLLKAVNRAETESIRTRINWLLWQWGRQINAGGAQP